jgi:molybdopterin-guanine dinucleotide biosynthesis protein A
MRLAGLILAGGEARRMGGADKALVGFDGGTLLSNAIARFAPQVEDLALSANGDPARFAAFGLPVLADAAPSRGPLSGLLAGLTWAAELGASALVSVPVDGPFLPPDLVPRLCLAAAATQGGGGAWVGPALAASPSGLHPTFGLWPTALAPALAAFLASGAKPRLRDFAQSHGLRQAWFDQDLAFANANTPEDLARLQALAHRGG